FPELAAFYQREVVRPCHDLVRRILQRGIERGEFVPLDLDHAIYAVIAPMLFLMLARHSSVACIGDGAPLDPERYIAAQSEIVLQGLCTPEGRRSAARTADAPWRPAPPAMPPPAS
ncbi:MAG TPA: TetR-like C-terminal domain-containing protein, partial [Burkholderiaceae bacterium]|nr:TetR-like C-terminal domain-containing protein [Burkholderiaceae bacterium]